MGTRKLDRKNPIKEVEVKVGDLIRIQRVWLMTNVTHVFGLVLGISETKWDKNYRLIKLLKFDGEVGIEPINVIEDVGNLEFLS